MRDHATPTSINGRPAMIVTTSGGLVITCHHRTDVEDFLGRVRDAGHRFPDLLDQWDAHAGPDHPATGGSVSDALTLVASYGRPKT